MNVEIYGMISNVVFATNSYSDPPGPCLAMPLHQEIPLLILSIISVTASIAVKIDSAVVVLVCTQQEVRKVTTYICIYATCVMTACNM